MFFNVPPLFRVLIVFALVLIVNRAGLHLGLCLLLGALGMGLWFERGVLDSLKIVMVGGFRLETILLLVVIFQILALTILMDKTGMMKKMIKSVRGLIPSRRVGFAMLPAMIGFLPMPGGAAVSAPMVDTADEDGVVAPMQKVAINYWFRHSWEYWWPLYPGVLLAAELSGLSILQISVLQFPLTFFSLGFGALFLLAPLKLGKRKPRPRGGSRDLFMAILPIIILMVLWLGFKRITDQFYKSKYLPMIIGLCGALAWAHFTGKPNKRDWITILKRKKSYLLLVVVIGVKAFSYALEAELPSGRRIVDEIETNLKDMRVPELFVVMLLPFISGIVTGLAVGFVGASFPIVVTIIGQGAPLPHVMSYVVLAYGCGYAGMMLSPVHVCFVVTNEYFNTKLLKAYKKIWGPALGVVIGAALISFIVSRFGG